jgi:hypothetical protein
MPNIAYTRKEVIDATPDWTVVSDCIQGQRQVKSKSVEYLPKPAGDLDPAYAQERYKAYITRALFYNATGRTTEGLVGQVFSKPPSYELPEQLMAYLDDIDGHGTGLIQQSKLILKDNVSIGHGGLLIDFPKSEGIVTVEDVKTKRVRPRILNYKAGNIINWDTVTIGGETKLSLLVLTEQKNVSEDKFEPEFEPRWRVFELIQEGNTLKVAVTVWKQNDNQDPNNKEQYVVESGPDTLMADGRFLDTIPFVFYGALNNEPTIDKPPMLDLANINIGHYRNSADYEEALYMVGQPTPVFTGLTQDWVDNNIKGKVILGSRSAVGLPEGATAELLQTLPNSMPHEGMKQKEDQMKSIGAKLIEPGFTKTTATQVLVDASSESSILTTATDNVSSAYRDALTFFAAYIGVSPEGIEFELNTDFDVDRMDAQERAQLILEWQSGAITWEEMRGGLRLAGVVTEDDDVAKLTINRELDDIPGNEPDPGTNQGASE